MTFVNSSATAVSRQIFADPAVHEAEIDRIFRRTWQFVAHEEEIPSRGDYVRRRLGLDEVVVVRDEHDQPRVFLNACRHRGAMLCKADTGNSSHFRCPYHGWTYSNAGALRGVPELTTVFPSDFDKNDFPLHEPPNVETLHGLIFAAWAPDAPSFEDFLSGFGWYLAPLFAKTEAGVEVAGPPSRIVIPANWKVLAENFAGDGYHLSTTHRALLDMGMLGDNVAKVETTGYNAHCGGHTIRIQKLPVDPDQPLFLGYPPEMWSTFLDQWSPQHVEMMSGLLVTHGVVFPNLGFLDGVIFWAGDDAAQVSILTLRQFIPIGPNSTEQLAWVFLPKDAPEDWKQQSRRIYRRTLGLGGIFDVDDTNNFTMIATSGAGPRAQETSVEFRGGTQLPRVDDLDWPGEIYVADHTETNQRAFFEHWAQQMEGSVAGLDGERARGEA